MQWGCGLGVVALLVFIVVSVQDQKSATTERVAFILLFLIFMVVAGAVIRGIGLGLPSAYSLDQKRRDQERAEKAAREKAESEERMKQERIKSAAAKAEHERKQALEERLKQEQLERDRQALKEARNAKPDEW